MSDKRQTPPPPPPPPKPEPQRPKPDLLRELKESDRGK